MHESESSPSHSVLESKSSHESLNLAHESDSSPSPGLESYNTVKSHTRSVIDAGTSAVAVAPGKRVVCCTARAAAW